MASEHDPVLEVVSDLSQQLSTVKHDVATETTNAIARLRNDVQKSINSVAAWVVRLENAYDADRRDRSVRQQEWDASQQVIHERLVRIEGNQERRLRRTIIVWTIAIVEGLIIAGAVGYVIGRIS